MRTILLPSHDTGRQLIGENSPLFKPEHASWVKELLESQFDEKHVMMFIANESYDDEDFEFMADDFTTMFTAIPKEVLRKIPPIGMVKSASADILDVDTLRITYEPAGEST